MHLTNLKFNPIKLLALGITFITFSAIFFLAAYGAPAERSELIDFHGKPQISKRLAANMELLALNLCLKLRVKLSDSKHMAWSIAI